MNDTALKKIISKRPNIHKHGNEYIFTSEMLSNTRLQNFLVTIDHRENQQPDLNQSLMNDIFTDGINAITRECHRIEAHKIYNFENGDTLRFEADGFINTDTKSDVEITGKLSKVFFTKKGKSNIIKKTIDLKSINDNFILELCALNYIYDKHQFIFDVTELSLELIFEYISGWVYEEIFMNYQPVDIANIIDNSIKEFMDDINSGNMPPECGDKWISPLGFKTRCEDYCKVRDICPFYSKADEDIGF
ncbi:MAG: hypothetical protein L3I99_05560 [Sulfurimonas sp.]|nr:hypothetical protein [Sulfurimonas sp.]